jgi:O-6-methylguanine DNA methyltransferase
VTAGYVVFPGPWGPIHAAGHLRPDGSGALVALELLTPTEGFVSSLERRLHEPVVPAVEAPPAVGALLGRVRERIEAYLRGERRDAWERADCVGSAQRVGSAERGRSAPGADREDRAEVRFPIDLVGLSEWDRRVLAGVASIPYGMVTSYGRLARLIGKPGAARAVGGAVGRNPVGILIPCHRVVAGDGSLGGYGGDWWGTREQLLGIKRGLLAIEDVALPTSVFFG